MHVSASNITVSDNFNISDYLDRIECPLDVNPSPRYLSKLHMEHLFHIPYENLGNFMGEQIILNVDRFYKRMIIHGRGGICYELNGLFYHLLAALGFQVKLVSARVYKDDQPGPEFDHLAIVVTFDEQLYLVDVGFGRGFIRPLKINPFQVQMDQNEYYRIDKTINDEFILMSSEDSQIWKPQYQFTLKERRLIEFVEMCEFHNRSPKSHLVKDRYVILPQRNGKLQLWDKWFYITKNGHVEKHPIYNLDEFKVKLEQHFGIKYSPVI